MKIKSTILKICILLLFVMAVTSVATAYKIGNDKFITKSVQVDYSGLPSDWRPTVVKSMTTWNNAANVTLVNRTNSSQITIDDVWNSRDLPSTTIAQESGTTGSYNGTLKKYEKKSSRILLNAYYFNLTTNPKRNTEHDLESVLTHELGHSLCLGHENKDKYYTMYEWTSANTTYKRSLEPDDINGIRAIYGRR